MKTLPETGFLRITHILGNPKTNTLPIIPVSKSTWWAGVKTGRFPQPIKLGPMITVWRVEDIRTLIDNFSQGIQMSLWAEPEDSSSTNSESSEVHHD
jgi:hypothetical protein